MRHLILVGLVSLAVVSTADARVWTSKGGGSIEADFVGLKDGKVQLRFQDGKIHDIPVGGLSDDDQAFLQNLRSEVDKQVNPAADPAGDASLTDRFSEAIRKSPGSPGVYYQRGISLLSQGEHDRALADFNKAIEIDPKYALAYDGRGQAYNKIGDAAAAHNDFTKAIEVDAEIASAYRHRAENLNDYAKTEEGKEYVYKGTENFRKKLAAAEQRNIRKTAWQPLHATKNLNPRLGMVPQLARADYDMAKQLEAKYGYGAGGAGYGGGGGSGYGSGGGPGVGPGVGSGTGPTGPLPPLSVYPEKVVKGQTITLTANSDELVKGMPQSLNGSGKPASTFNRRRGGNKEDIKEVEFYRDANGNGTLEPENDQLLASDTDGSDGYAVEVSTSSIPAGQYAFFALPTGGEQPNPEMLSAYEKLMQAAKAERRVAERAEKSAAEAGLTDEQASSLNRTQQSVAKTAAEIAAQYAEAAPEAAKLLAESKQQIEGADEQFAQAGSNPGEASKAPAKSGAQQAEAAAKQLEAAAEKLREAAAQPGNGEALAGKPVQGAGEITPAGPKKEKLAGGPGKGPGGSGSDSPSGGSDNNDSDEGITVNVNINDDDDDLNVNVGDDDDRDVTVNVDVDDTIDRALGYIDDGDYDNAVVEYDRLIESEPDRDYYYRSRGDAYLAGGRYDYAIRDYDQLVKVGGEMTADLYYNRGCAYLAARQYDNAIADFTSSIELDETGSLAWNNRGSTYARLGDFPKAVSDFTRAIAINADDIVAYRNRALAYKKMGEAAKSAADQQQIERLSGQ